MTSHAPLAPQEKETLARLCGLTTCVISACGGLVRAADDGTLTHWHGDEAFGAIPPDMLRVLIRHYEEKRK